ncbi:MAG TPA: ABC transporter ATP-binding protein [Caulobacteraceae bacterium]|nr:ABC transporter ATP-binding protein [Caulobacteraceae bacterium]
MTDFKPEVAAPSLPRVAMRVARDYLRPFAGKIAIAVLAALAVAASTSVLTYLMKPAANAVLRNPAGGTVASIAAMLVGLAFVRAGAQVVQSWTMNTVGHRIVGRIQVDLFGRIIHSDLARLRSEHSGSIVSAMLYDATLLRNAATNALLTYFQNLLLVVGLVVVMLVQDVWLTLGILLVGPLIGALMQRFTKWSKAAAVGAMRETSSLSTAIMEGIDGVKVVKIDNREAYEQARVAAAVDRRQRHIIRGANIGAASSPVVELMMAAILSGVLVYAWWRAHGDIAYAGVFTSYIIAFAAAGQSLRQLANLPPVFAEGLAAAQRMFASMDIEHEVADAADATPLAAAPELLRFEDVRFAYGEAATALNGVTLEARRGETVALVGPSGGGKTTILNLIPRFYDVSAGAITLDGRDLRSIKLASLRGHIALVTQEPFLFDESIRANIAYSRPEATDAEIEAAARAAAAHEFIVALEKGYATTVGEAGARLSGGQRQRIAIARAFLKNAPILLLDEATSALDTESEALVQAALERLMAGRMTLLIAHRLSTVKGADRIYVIADGRVVETGTHAQLTRSRGLYARLATAQNLDAAPEAAE